MKNTRMVLGILCAMILAIAPVSAIAAQSPIDLSAMTVDELYAIIDEARLALAKVEINKPENTVVQFDEYDVTVAIDGWKIVNYLGGSKGLEFSATVISNTEYDFEVCVADCYINGWTVLGPGNYASVCVIQHGRKAKDSFSVSDILAEANVSNEDELEDMEITFFLKNPNGGQRYATKTMKMQF